MIKNIIILLSILGTAAGADANWTVPEQVNDTNFDYGIQANRDGDTPWGIATDDSGNVHFVFESRAVFGDHNLDIHYRDLDYINWNWHQELSVTELESFDHDSFGHPSIIFNEITQGLISYCVDQTNWEEKAEMRTRIFDYYGQNIFGNFDFMSNVEGKYSFGGSGADGLKTPVMAIDGNGVIYGFWIYPDTVDGTVFRHVYFNKNINLNWGIEQRHEIYTSHYSYEAYSICALVDPGGDIHLVMAIRLAPSDASIEVYHCYYDVSEEDWSDLELVSEVSEPDGYNSTLPYLSFREIPLGYKMYVVWEDYDPEGDDHDILIRIYDSLNETWNTETLVYNSEAGSPSVAALSNGDIFVVWDDIINDLRWIYYKVYDCSLSSWSSLNRIPYN